MQLPLEELRVFSVRTACAYDLTRVSLPTAELNLTNKITIGPQDGGFLT